MKTISGVLSDLAIKLNEKLGGEPLNDSKTKSVTGCLQQIANVLSGNSGDSKTVIGALESIADAVENIDIGGGGDEEILKALIERQNSNSYEITIPDGTEAIGNSCFRFDYGVTKVIAPDSVKSIYLSAFYNAINLKEIKADGVTAISGASNADDNPTFKCCWALEKASFKSVEMFDQSFQSSAGIFDEAGKNASTLDIDFSGLEVVPSYLFGGSYATNINLASVKQIGKYSLTGILKPVTIYIGANCSTIDSDAFQGLKSGSVVNCGFAEGAVSGAPWGATNATINYNVPVPTVD